MTKVEFVKFFKSTDTYIREMQKPKGKRDLPLLRLHWNVTVDLMIRNGILKERAGNWTHLKEFY